MFFRNVQPKDGITLDVVLANVHLPLRLTQENAHRAYADPLKEQMTVASLGTVLDCRSRKRANGQIKGIDIYLGLRDPSHEGMLRIAHLLEALAAPCGSSIRLAEGLGAPLLFGRTEGLELEIDAAEDKDMCNHLARTCSDALDKAGVSRGWNHADECTRFYFYGESFDEMKSRLDEMLNNNAELSGARLRRVA